MLEDLKVPKDLKVHKEILEILEQEDHKVLKDLKVLRGHKDLKEVLV